MFDVSHFQIREVDTEGWRILDRAGEVREEGTHGFGRLPIEILYGKRRPLTPFIGKSIMGDPGLYIDLYNLTSEVRELLRNQTFALLNVPIGKDGSYIEEQAMMGRQTGTSSVLFSTNPAQFISPGGENVQAYHEHMDRLARSIYRLARTPWESDSRDAESADSRRIKRQEMNDTLVKYAQEMQRTERGLVELAYRAMNGEGWEAAMQRDEAQVIYPETFNPPDMSDVVEQAGGALALDLGETWTKAYKKHVAKELLPMSPEMAKQVEAEIEAMEVKTAEEKRQELMQMQVSRFGARAEAMRQSKDEPDEGPKEAA